MAAHVALERQGSLAWVVFDNPERRNALTGGMIEDALGALQDAAKDDRVRAVVLRGAGDKAFVSGADISAFGTTSFGPVTDVIDAMAMGKPVVAALRGWCLGAGALLALAADMRIAGDDVRVGIPAAKLGVAYPRQGVERIVALAGPAVASELLLTGEPLDAHKAERVGLVNRVVAADTVFEEAASLADALAANAPMTLRASKLAIAGDPSADDAIRACFESEDFAEGQRAFAEKRAPRFEGR